MAQQPSTETGLAPQGTETTAHTEAAHEKGVFPPLATETYAGQIFWLVVCFGALYLLMSRVVLPRVGAVLEQRVSHVNADLARAMALKEETEAALAAYEKSLSDARRQAQGIIQDNQARLLAESEAERHRVEADLSAKMSEADARIQTSKTKAMAQVDHVAQDAAQAIVEQLTGPKNRKAGAALGVSGTKA